MNEDEYNAAFFPAKCLDCGAKFSAPALSDFSYGQWIIHGEKGRAFAYLDAINEPTFDEIRHLLLKIAGLTKFESDTDVDKFQSAVASCADEVNGERLRTERRCRECLSTSVTRYDVASPLFKDIPCATFSKFHALSDDQKMELLSRLWDSGASL